MPEEKVKPSAIPVDIDTSGPEVDVAVEEVKEEAVVETKEEEPRITEVEKEEPAKEEVKDDSKLEEYSKGVCNLRIAKLTRKMREAERKEAAAVQYAQFCRKSKDRVRFRINLMKLIQSTLTKLEDNM